MTTPQTETTMFPVNYRFEMVGNLGHDNKLFDRTCTNCKGMYSSYEVASCPKCGQQLTFITTREGKAMSVSEGTIYPAFGSKQKERDNNAIANRKNGMPAIYRFKIFSFADANGVIPLPQDHHRMKSGAMVKIAIMNHQLIPSWFMSKGTNQAKVELMIQIYPQYGDGIIVLRDAQAAQATTAMAVGPGGQHADVNINSLIDEIAKLELRIAAMKGQAIPTGPVNNTVVTDGSAEMAAEAAAMESSPPWEDGAETAMTGGEVNPFENA